MTVASFWYKRTTLLCVFFGSIIAGIAAARIIDGISGVLVIGLILPVIISLKKHSLALLISIAVLGTVAGIWRGGLYLQQIMPMLVPDLLLNASPAFFLKLFPVALILGVHDDGQVLLFQPQVRLQ